MATEIKFEDKSKAVLFKTLKDGDKFTLELASPSQKGVVFMRIPVLFHESGDMYSRNSINLMTGEARMINNGVNVIPVDVSITAYR